MVRRPLTERGSGPWPARGAPTAMSSRDRAEPRRVDLYSTVHKGLRAFLADTQLAVGRADASDREEVDVALRQTRDLLELCRVHLDDENRFIHPASRRARAGRSIGPPPITPSTSRRSSGSRRWSTASRRPPTRPRG